MAIAETTTRTIENSGLSPEAQKILMDNLEKATKTAPINNINNNVSKPEIPQDAEFGSVAKTMQDQGIGQVKRKNDYSVTFTVQLPSEGKFYPTTSSCYGIKEVIVKELLPEDEDILYSRKLLNTGKAFDVLIKKTVITPINTEELLASDKFAILLALRINSFGEDYNPSSKDNPVKFFCDNCKNEFDHTFDLSQLSIKKLSDDPIQINDDGTITCETPSGHILKIRFLTSKDENFVEEEILASRRLLKNNDVEKIFSIRLKHQIVEIDGNKDKSFIKESLSNGLLKMKDSRFLRHFLNNHMPEVELKQNAQCSECFVMSEQQMPITKSFFYEGL